MFQTLKLPSPLKPLRQLAYNLKWSWTPSTQALFSHIDQDLWQTSRNNPVTVLLNASPKRLEELAQDTAFCQQVAREHESLQNYLQTQEGGLEGEAGQALEKNLAVLRERGPVAYFSAEFGLHESLPIYAGGLGVLAGDHTKSASDLNIPFVGIGLMYRSGYFEQTLDTEGQQHAEFPQRNFQEMCIQPVLNEKDQPLILDIPLPGRSLFFGIWKAQVGRSTLYLLDTQLDSNTDLDQALTSQLYGGDTSTRICQEMLLGVGGVRALQALHIEPSVYHLNEGHAAFVGVERARQMISAEPSLSFKDAITAITRSQVFTTHTPVPAGHDRFTVETIQEYMKVLFSEEQHKYFPDLIDMGLEYKDHMNSMFCMTVLALHTARACNGVSKIHGEVSRKMWQHLWPSKAVEEVPIGHITNGVHAATWTSQSFHDLFTQHIDRHWDRQLGNPEIWAKARKIPTEELWKARQTCKQELIDFARYRIQLQRKKRNEPADALAEVEGFLNPDALTIGFARRFAPYKRATLILSDPERLAAILNHPEKPVQILFAGKAHPHNREGQALLQKIYQYSRMPEFSGKIIWLENYDMAVGRHLVKGVDVWLNNPTPPQEASGTSGQKVGLNGGLNCSILDGWWDEGYTKESNGWAIGEGQLFDQKDQQNQHDANSLYTLLETKITPLFYDRDEQGIPQGWLNYSRSAMESLIAPFNTHRMVCDYLNDIYLG